MWSFDEEMNFEGNYGPLNQPANQPTLNLVILDNFFYCRVWSLSNLLLPQFSVDPFQTVYTF